MHKGLQVISGIEYDDLSKYKDNIISFIQENCCINKESKVAVKLNLVGPFAPEKAATTHPMIVDIIIQVLSTFHCSIMICEDIENEEVLVKTGIKEVLDKYNLDFYPLRDYGYSEIAIGKSKYQYSNFIKNADMLIDVPKLKTHMLTAFTGAIKNMYGAIQKGQRKALHKSTIEEFSDHICSIYSICKPQLIFMDAIICMEGLGPSIGAPKYVGNFIMGVDGVEVDYYACRMVGYEVDKLKLLQVAATRKISHNLYINKKEEKSEDIKVIAGFSRIPLFEGKYSEKYIDILKRSYHVEKNLCIKCRKCIMNCPFGAITFEEYPIFNRDKCELCTCCMELCPVNAINY